MVLANCSSSSRSRSSSFSSHLRAACNAAEEPLINVSRAWDTASLASRHACRVRLTRLELAEEGCPARADAGKFIKHRFGGHRSGGALESGRHTDCCDLCSHLYLADMNGVLKKE